MNLQNVRIFFAMRQLKLLIRAICMIMINNQYFAISVVQVIVMFTKKEKQSSYQNGKRIKVLGR